MLLKTILNRVAPQKSFVYRKVTMVPKKGEVALEVDIEARRNSQAVCSGCHRKRPGYNRLPPRRFEFVPLWQIAVFFVYSMRRVDCPKCGVVVEEVPWSEGKSKTPGAASAWYVEKLRRLTWSASMQLFSKTAKYKRSCPRMKASTITKPSDHPITKQS
jgi:transposase